MMISIGLLTCNFVTCIAKQFAWGVFSRKFLDRELSENNPQAKIHTFTVQDIVVSVFSQDLDFLHHMSWSLLVFNELRWQVVVRFVDIGGIDDHHCLNLHFITNCYNTKK